MPFKTTVNWLFNDIWCYLVIGCSDWKISVFQQTVLRGFIASLNCAIEEHSKAYDNFIFIGNFDVGIDENSMKNFCDINCLQV